MPIESVSSTSVHRSGSVVMTCSDERHSSRGFDAFNNRLFSSDIEDARKNYSYSGDDHRISQGKDSLTDSSLRLWSLL